MSECKTSLEQMFGLVNGELDAASSSSLRMHLDQCEQCSARLAEVERYQVLLSQVRESVANEPLPWAALDRKVDQAIAQSVRRPLWEVIFGASGRVWGPVFAAAAVALLVVAVMRYVQRPADAPQQTAKSVGTPLAVESPRPRLNVREPSTPMVEVAVVSGTVTFQQRGKAHSVTVGQQIPWHESQRWRTGDGVLSLRLNQHTVTLNRRSQMRIMRHAAGVTRIDLLSGSVLSDVYRRKPGEIYRIDAGRFRVLVRGTQFLVARKGPSGVSVKVLRGKVAVVDSRKPDEEKIVLAGTEIATDGDQELGLVTPKTTLEPDQPDEPLTFKVKRRSHRPHKRHHVRRHQKLRQPEPRRIAKIKPTDREIMIEVPHQEMKVVHDPKLKKSPTTVVVRYRIPAVFKTAVAAARSAGYKRAIGLMMHFLGDQPGHRNRADALYIIGYCYHKLGDKTRAHRFLRAYLQAAPRGPWMRTAKDFINPPAPSYGKLRR